MDWFTRIPPNICFWDGLLHLDALHYMGVCVVSKVSTSVLLFHVDQGTRDLCFKLNIFSIVIQKRNAVGRPSCIWQMPRHSIY